MTGAASQRLGVALAGASAVFMCGVALIGKALLETMSPWLFATWFFGAGAASYLVLFVVRPSLGPWHAGRDALVAGLLVGVLDGCYSAAYCWTLDAVSPGLTSFLDLLANVAATVLGIVVLRERYSRGQLVAFLLVLAGLLLLTLRADVVVARATIVMLLGAGFFAVNTVVIRRVTRRVSPIHLAFYRAVVISLAMATLSGRAFGDLRWPTHDEWPLVVAIGVIGPFLNYLTYFTALKHLEIGYVVALRMNYALLVVAVGAALGYTLPTGRQLAGGALLLAGAVWLVLARARNQRAR